MNDLVHAPETDRREIILDDWLNRIENGRATTEECLAQHPELRDEMEPMLRAAQRLFAVEIEPLSAETVGAIRDRVFSRVPVARKTAAPRGGLGLALPLARLAGVTVAFVLILTAAMAGVWQVSADSLPGSPLYPIKRGAETAQLAIARNPAERAYLHMSFALRRVNEGLRLEQVGGQWTESTAAAALGELKLAEDSIDQAETAGAPIDWQQMAQWGAAGERELAGVDRTGPSGRGLADAFRGLEQRARRRLQTGPDTESAPSPTPPIRETGEAATATPAPASTDANHGAANGQGEQQKGGQGSVVHPQGSTHLQQTANPTAGPGGQNTPSVRRQQATTQPTIQAAQPHTTRTPAVRGSATGAFAHSTATPHATSAPTAEPTTAPTVEPTNAPTVEPTAGPGQGQENAPQGSGESSGGQDSGGSSGGGGGGSSSSGGSGGGSSSGGGSRGGKK